MALEACRKGPLVRYEAEGRKPENQRGRKARPFIPVKSLACLCMLCIWSKARKPPLQPFGGANKESDQITRVDRVSCAKKRKTPNSVNNIPSHPLCYSPKGFCYFVAQGRHGDSMAFSLATHHRSGVFINNGGSPLYSLKDAKKVT